MSEKPAAVVGHNQIAPSLLLELMGIAQRAKREADEALGKYRNVRKRMADAGVDMQALALVEKLAKLSPEEATDRLKSAFRLADILDVKIAQQAELFPEGPDDSEATQKAQARWREDQAEDQGYRAGKAGRDRSDNPFPAGQPHAAAWDRGWGLGQAAIAAEMGPEGKKPKQGKRGRGAEMGPQG